MDYRFPIERLKEVPSSELPDIAEKTGVGLQTLRDIVNGRPDSTGTVREMNPRLSTLEALAAYFGTKKEKARA